MTTTAQTPREALGLEEHKSSHDISPGEISIGVIIGRTSEFFDFFVFAIASVMVFPAVIFPYVDRLTGTLYSFAIFGLAFIARPIGSVAFMALDRATGRGTKLTVALFLLGGSTAAIAFLPTYESIGHNAAVLLAVFRLLQGFALGGTWDGLASLLALNAPEGKRGWYAMVPQIGAPVGLLIASLLFAYMIYALPAGDFLGWGWRYPFFVALAINVVALFSRLRIVVTPEFERLFESRDLQPEPFGAMLSLNWRTVVAGAFAPLASFALFHMVSVFPLSWTFLFTNEVPTHFLVMEGIAAVIGIVTTVLSGVLADKFGRRNLLGGCAIAIAVFAVLAPMLLSSDSGQTLFLFIGFALLGLTFGQCSGVVATGFTAQHRYTGAALTGDLAWLIGAGFAPLVALALASHFGLWASGAYLLSGAIATLIALWWNKGLASRT